MKEKKDWLSRVRDDKSWSRGQRVLQRWEDEKQRQRGWGSTWGRDWLHLAEAQGTNRSQWQEHTQSKPGEGGELISVLPAMLKSLDFM